MLNYDDLKTTPPEPEPEPVTYCSICGCEIWEGDEFYTIDGAICEDCLNDEYRKIASFEDFKEE